MEFVIIELRLIVRCRETKVELKSLEVEAIGLETNLFNDTTESLLKEQVGTGSVLWVTLLINVEG